MAPTHLLLLVSLVLPAQESPLINYQAMEALKGTLAEVTLEVEVRTGVPEGADPSIAPMLVGQAVCVPDVAGRQHIITSAYLVEGASRLRLRSKQTPDWVMARTVRIDLTGGLAELAPAAEEIFVCQTVNPAAPALEGPGGLVFSIDNPTAWTAIFFGNLIGHAESPLQDYLLSGSGLPLGGPLYDPQARLGALNLRRYVVGGKTNLAATATQVWRWVWGKRRGPSDMARRPRRGLATK